MQPLNNASWYPDVSLEHSPSGVSLYYKGPALQKMIPGFWGLPSYKTDKNRINTRVNQQ